MTMVRKGDLLFHHFDGHIVAISIAASDFYESGNPYNSNINTSWHLNEGYKVDVDYYEVNPIAISAHAHWIIDNHIESGTFTRAGKAPQGKYISEFDNTYAIYFLKALRIEQDDTNIISVIDNALTQFDEDIESPYNEIEKEEINELVNTISDSETPTWGSSRKEQETTILPTSQKEIPVRKTKTALGALIKANYLCEYNPSDRTFPRKNGKPYTEPHHLIPISKYKEFECSLDVLENIVSLCSHCHNLIHYGRFEEKMPVIEKLYETRKTVLENYGIAITLDELLKYYQ